MTEFHAQCDGRVRVRRNGAASEINDRPDVSGEIPIPTPGCIGRDFELRCRFDVANHHLIIRKSHRRFPHPT